MEYLGPAAGSGVVFIDEDMLRDALKAHEDAILAQVSMMLEGRPANLARDAVIVSNTWDPKTGTVEATFGDTATIFGDDVVNGVLGDRGVSEKLIPVGGDQGAQHGYVGGERITLLPTQSGYLGLARHEEDDSPGALAGEKWFTHRDQTGPKGNEYLGVVNAFVKLLNDGAQSGDKKGGLSILAGSLLSILTGAGITIMADDNAKQLTLKTADGSQVLIDGNAGTITMQNAAGAKVDLIQDGSIDVAATTITYVGARVVLATRGGAGGANPVVRTTELQAAIDGITTSANAAFARCQGGGGVQGMVGPVATGSPNVSSG